MKKLLALCLTVVLVLAMVPIIGASAEEGKVTLSVSNAAGLPGEEVTVSVDISNNPGLTFAQVKVGYFAEALEVVKIDKLMFADIQTTCGPLNKNPLSVTWADCLQNTTDNGSIANITFKIKENAAPGDYVITVTATQANVFAYDFSVDPPTEIDVPFETKNAIITVECDHNAEWLEVADEDYLATEANCTEAATYYKSCSKCGVSSDETFAYGDALGHDWVEIVGESFIVTPASCTELATYYKSCSRCTLLSEETFTSGDLLAHDWVEVVADEYLVSEATCEAKATYYKSCSICNVASEETFETGELADHSYGDWFVAVKPTFTEDGSKQKVCSVCTDTVTEVIPARIPAEFAVSTDAKRVAPGEEVEFNVDITSNPGIAGVSLWLDYNSDVLEIVEFVDGNLGDRAAAFSETDNDPAIIRWIGDSDNTATGTVVTIVFKVKADAADGIYDMTLSTNQDEVFDQDFDDVAYTLVNSTVKVSSSCPDNEHVWTQVVADEYLATVATCEDKATYYLSCSECSEVATATFEAGEVDLTNHIGVNTVHEAVESTCTVAGNNEYETCDGCGTVVVGSDEPLELVPHTPIEVVDDKYLATEATCTAKATYYKSCEVCANAVEETFESGEVLAHTWANVVDDNYLFTEADCISRAVYYMSCSECGETNYDIAFVDGTLNPDRHIGTTTVHDATDSTCAVAGNEAYVTCDDCGAVIEGNGEKLPLVPHTFEEVVDDKYLVSAATCIANAKYYVSCSVCGNAGEETFEVEGYVDHAFDSDDDYACNVCKYTRAPGAPTVLEAEPTAVTLVAVEGYEYSIDGVNWQSSNVFEDLEANTEYKFYQRIAATDTHDVSAASEAVIVSTSCVIGDINLDGKINGKDYVVLAQYINGWDVEICEPAADVNGDDTINGKDMALLVKYLNGYEIENIG